MRISFVFLLSLLLGAGVFAQNAPVKSELESYKNTEQRAMYFKDSMRLNQEIQIFLMNRYLDSLRNITTTKANVSTDRETCNTSTPKPWFSIPNRPTLRALGGFQLGYGYPIGYHAAVGVGVRCQVMPHWSFSLLAKGNQLVANDSMGSWLRRTKTAASVRGAVEYVGLFPNEPAKYCWQVSGYFEKYFFPGTINWSHVLTKDPLTAPVIVNLKHSLRLPDQRMGIQGKILVDAFTLGAFAEFYPRIEATRDGQRLRYGGGLFVGFGL